ncbi:DUF3857 domain-containing protein [Psychroflexus sp. ALD_RP9]|uniref:DUF3857 domain-containing protein n=1 Tax=Psychroflexus sp. ALD_RP9 TaxID=2777186 RepID=UPI001A9082F4|nr:DUF3857 domain-containing protein [Psychroflexus sp. ALD_RP9]QSS97128.1 DUF3857 and transglutaminase domain-containing protein [Psychroflexus sp. ALD_RP9]
MRFTNFCIFLFCVTLSTIAQTDLKKITINDLKQTVHPLDSTASAAVLFDQGEISFEFTDGWNYTFNKTSRIKIYTKDGLNQADIMIPFYVGNSNAEEERVINIKGYVYNLKNGKITRDKIKNRNIYEEEPSELWHLKKLALPNVQEGSIIEVSYTIKSPHVTSLPKWTFQKEIPVDFSEFVLISPATYLAYRPYFRGEHNLETNTDIQEGEFYYRSGNSTGRSSRGKIASKINITSIVAKNVPKITGENFVNNVSNYQTSVKYEIASVKGLGQRGKRKNFNQTWKDVSKIIMKSDDFGKELLKSKYFEDDIDALVNSTPNQLDRLMLIFNHVKSKMKWNNKNRLFCTDKLKRIYENGEGNSAEINLMLTAMLKYAGIEAYPVVSSTIAKGIPFSPTISGFNYVTSLAIIDNKTYHLDATEPYSAPNVLPKRVLNWIGRIIYSEEHSEQFDLMPKSPSKLNTNLTGILKDNGEIEGQVREVFCENFALGYRNSRSNMPIDKQVELLKENYEGIEVSNFTNKFIKDLSKPVMRSYQFKTKASFSDVIGDKIYITPMLFFKTDENPFKDKTRNYPIDFTYPRSLRQTFNISIPDGYTIDYVPEKKVIGLPNQIGTYQYLVMASGTKIQLTVIFNINASILPSEYYESLKELYQTIVDQENEKIVLSKV